MSELEKLCKADHDYWRVHGGPWLAPWDEYKKLYEGDYSTYRISSAADRRLGAPFLPPPPEARKKKEIPA